MNEINITKMQYGEHAERIVGKFVLARAGHGIAPDGSHIPRTMLGGVLVGTDLVTCQSWEAWDGEIILLPTAKYRGGVAGHTISSLLTSGFLNAPSEYWTEKYL